MMEQPSDEAVVALLAQPEVLEGVAIVNEALKAQFDSSAQGQEIGQIIHGVTAEGTCLAVAQVGGRKGKYVGYSYSLDEVTKDGLEQAPQLLQIVKTEGSTLTIEDPVQTTTGWYTEPGRPTELLPRVVPVEHTLRIEHGLLDRILYATFDGLPVRNFLDARLGDKRRALLQQELDSLENARLEVIYTSREAVLQRLGERMTRNALRHPTAYDQPGLVHNPEKAERMAYAAKPHLEKEARTSKVVKSLRALVGRDVNLQHAEEAMLQAEEAYDPRRRF